MPYVAPAAVASGAVISKTTFGDVVIADLNFLANAPTCRVYHNTTQSIAHNTAQAVVFNSKRWDTDTMHSTSVNTNRITLTTAGVYAVSFVAALTGGTDYTRVTATLRVNGVLSICGATVTQTTKSHAPQLNLTTIWKFVAADYVEALITQENGASAARNLLSVSAETPEFAANWIGLG